MLEAIVDFGGFNRAAERLGVSQSAVSQALANLEHKLGTVLVVRGRKPDLTEAGRRVFNHARLVLSEERQALADVEQIKTGALSTLSLATDSMVNRKFSQTLLLSFCDSNPLTRLKLDVVPSKEMIYGVEEGRWELGFGPFLNEMPPHLTCKPLLDEDRVLAVHEDHPLFQRLMREPAEALSQTTLLTSYLDEATSGTDQGRLRSRFGAVWEVSNLELRLALAAAGKGVVYLSNHVLPEAPGMHPIAGMEAASIPRKVGIYWRRHDALSSGARLFAALCDRYFSEARP